MRLKLFICLLAASSLNQQLPAEIDARFTTIIDRNAFGLGQEIIKTPEPPPPILQNVKFTGISDSNGETLAYFVIAGKTANEPARFVRLKAGESDGALELRKIDRGEGAVHIRNTTVDQILKLGAEPSPKLERVIPLRSPPKF